jgi:hypothetical protein
MGVLGVGAVCGFVHGLWVHMGTRVSLHVGQVLLQVGLAHGCVGCRAVCGFVHGQWVHMGTRVSLHVGQVLLQVGLAHGWDSGMVRWA